MGAKKELFLLAIEEYNYEKQNQVFQLIEKVLENGFEKIKINWIFYDIKLNKEIIESISNIICRLGTQYEFFVHNQIETNQYNTINQLKKYLNRYNFHVLLCLTSDMPVRKLNNLGKKILLTGYKLQDENYENYRYSYKKYRSCGLEMFIDEQVIETSEFKQWFSDWLNDENANWINYFYEMIFFLFSGKYLSDCAHDSCMGKHLYVDKAGMVYFCSKKKKGGEMYLLSEQGKDLFCGSYKWYLQIANKKRRQCVDNCDFFLWCQGGCILEKQIMHSEKNDILSRNLDKDGCQSKYLLHQQIVKDMLKPFIKECFTGISNPLLQQMFIIASINNDVNLSERR